jgi:hypothetical protein
LLKKTKEALDTVLAKLREALVGNPRLPYSGWISRHSWWFDHYLTNEEIDEYRKTIA